MVAEACATGRRVATVAVPAERPANEPLILQHSISPTLLSLGLAALVACATPCAAGSWSLGQETIRGEFPDGAFFFEKEARNTSRSVRIHGVLFPDASYTLKVIDNPDPPSGNLSDAMRSNHCIAGVNGGYFHPDFRPVGLVVSNGETLHGFERARLLTGVLGVDAGGPRLQRNSEFEHHEGLAHALQSGPFLVDQGEPVAGLNDVRPARRTVVATDGDGNWLLAVLSPVTLAAAAEILSSSEIFPGFPVRRALNLDGGSSSGLWVDTTPKPFYQREFNPVRNFIGIVPQG